jgi:hypothetical protein
VSMSGVKRPSSHLCCRWSVGVHAAQHGCAWCGGGAAGIHSQQQNMACGFSSGIWSQWQGRGEPGQLCPAIVVREREPGTWLRSYLLSENPGVFVVP